MPDPQYAVTILDRGAGFTCPHCGGKFIANLDRFAEPIGRRVNRQTVLCPYCERCALLPERTK